MPSLAADLADETARTPREAARLDAQGVTAGERALGPRACVEELAAWGLTDGALDWLARQAT